MPAIGSYRGCDSCREWKKKVRKFTTRINYCSFTWMTDSKRNSSVAVHDLDKHAHAAEPETSLVWEPGSSDLSLKPNRQPHLIMVVVTASMSRNSSRQPRHQLLVIRNRPYAIITIAELLVP